MPVRSISLLLPLALLAAHLLPSGGQALDRRLYQQVLQLSLQPRGNDVVNAQIQKAIIELVWSHFNAARGAPYPIGAATGLFTSGRKKRFASFGSSYNNKYNDWGSSRFEPSWGFPFSGGWNKNNNDYHPHPHPHPETNTNKGKDNFKSYGGGRQIIHCPTQANQSAVYNLNPSNVDYPATNIGNEFFFRSLPGSDLFFQCAVRRAILPNQPPVVEVDQNFVTANSTCPSTDLPLFSFTTQNTAIGGRCFVVQGFQEAVQFSVCQQKNCVNCDLKKRQSNPYSHHIHPGYGTNNVTINRCITDYRTVQVLAYCENLPVNQRIVYDRIIIPLFCSCKTIDCMTNPHW